MDLLNYLFVVVFVVVSVFVLFAYKVIVICVMRKSQVVLNPVVIVQVHFRLLTSLSHQ